MLVVGEGRNPVNVAAGSGYPGSSSASSSNVGKGTGTLVPLNQHKARSEWPQKVHIPVCFAFV